MTCDFRVEDFCSIGELAELLGVAVITLRRWDKGGKLPCATRTAGGHRRYDISSVKVQLGMGGSAAPGERVTVAYARVSSHDQKEQLSTQAQRLRLHCQRQGWSEPLVLEDLGSGMNYRKPGLGKLIKMLVRGEVARLVLVTKDRLLRFGSEILFQLCKLFQVEVIILDEVEASSAEQQLTRDLVEILTVFSSRLYGSRSRKNLRALIA